jgi:hypothetical protein
MGQTRSVTVKHLYIKNSVEERIIQVAEAKADTGAAGGAAGAGAAALAAADATRKGKAK